MTNEINQGSAESLTGVVRLLTKEEGTHSKVTKDKKVKHGVYLFGFAILPRN